MALWRTTRKCGIHQVLDFLDAEWTSSGERGWEGDGKRFSGRRGKRGRAGLVDGDFAAAWAIDASVFCLLPLATSDELWL